MIGATPVAEWQAARTHPHTYPGRCPEGPFVLIDGLVHGLHRRPDDGRWPDFTVDGQALSALLAERSLPSLADRVPVLAYGGNRSPATLALKLRHYDYVSPGDGDVLPVLPARMTGADVVGAALSAQGYLYADLYADATTARTELSLHVLLADADQLRVLNDSEGVRTDFYDAAMLHSVILDDLPGAGVPVLAYLATGTVFVSPETGTPLALAAVTAAGRTLPEFDATGMLAHAVRVAGLSGDVVATVGTNLDPDVDVAGELMRYLNGQWWFRQHTGLRRLRACERLEQRIRTAMTAYSVPSTRDALDATVVPVERAYAAGDLTMAALAGS